MLKLKTVIKEQEKRYQVIDYNIGVIYDFAKEFDALKFIKDEEESKSLYQRKRY